MPYPPESHDLACAFTCISIKNALVSPIDHLASSLTLVVRYSGMGANPHSSYLSWSTRPSLTPGAQSIEFSRAGKPFGLFTESWIGTAARYDYVGSPYSRTRHRSGWSHFGIYLYRPSFGRPAERTPSRHPEIFPLSLPSRLVV